MFDDYLSFKLFNKISKTCFHDKEWKLHLYVKPKFPKNMKIKEHFRQNVIKRVEKIPPGYPRTHIKIPGFLYIHNPGIFYSGIFQVSKSRDYLVPGFFDPGISRDIPGPGYPVDIPSANQPQILETKFKHVYQRKKTWILKKLKKKKIANNNFSVG